MSKYICIREAYDWIYVGDKDNELSESEFEDLLIYLNDKKDNFKTGIIDVKYKKLRLINYVGIISINNVIIEIVPKISLSNDREKDRALLLQMLSKCNKLPFSINESLNLNLKNYNLIELIVKFFIENLSQQINRGMYLEYINKEENINVIKGKLLLSNHIKKNHSNKVKAYCGYDEYSENNFLNLVFKTACTVILRKINNDDVKNGVKRILSLLADVDLNYIDNNKLLKYKFHRQNKRFKESYEFAKLILLNMSMENTKGNESAFSMLFEINTLYEEYIANILSQLWNNQNRNIFIQDSSKYLLENISTNRGNFNLKPDIVLNDNKEKYQIIIDTKWKLVDSKIEPSDMYQMYAYITRYPNSKKCILLYPCMIENNTYSKWRLFEPFEEKYIEVKTVRLENLNSTIEDLKSILDL
ncbi:McrC family protein [Paraclostridium sordellii]|uniref:McrC family protein n=1 Tax=Paraclostridium sordellii TaxID=1505 RepID=UPI0005E1E10C|nr:McrC family protein [Paeniclostridium sordellii]CEO24223.1 5-methylcytosine restriction system component-like protein [[Clostridium] sordellii] [Paeniclostridium sordellii]